MLTVEQLQATYPYMFKKRNLGYEFYRVWLPILSQASAEIDALLGGAKADFHWCQIKEKWGSARFYCRLRGASRSVIDVQTPGDGVATIQGATRKGDPLAERIDEIVDAAQAKTRTACIAGGQVAETFVLNGYVWMLCTNHRPPPEMPPEQLSAFVAGLYRQSLAD